VSLLARLTTTKGWKLKATSIVELIRSHNIDTASTIAALAVGRGEHFQKVPRKNGSALDRHAMTAVMTVSLAHRQSAH
jgi:hypothetical protein